ncbi:unnamed protein product [Rotaria magnacalcarata]|uniref:FLYWCH-type domain-containing protein n=1 Tax=Rotaria magnacalcarata TaxID=392030 RepID=A0A814F2Q7_9BILA|nr:unnamed protein product [Rotaria magnacalcarata]
MDSDIEWTKTNRGTQAFIYKKQKYRKRCSNKDGSEISVCCNKSCGISIVLQNGIIKRYPQKHLHDELQHTPEIRNLLQNISTAYRRRSSVLPPIPKTLEDIVIPDSLKFLQNGDRYVTFDNPVPNRLIILCSSETLLALSMFSQLFL